MVDSSFATLKVRIGSYGTQTESRLTHYASASFLRQAPPCGSNTSIYCTLQDLTALVHGLRNSAFRQLRHNIMSTIMDCPDAGVSSAIALVCLGLEYGESQGGQAFGPSYWSWDLCR
jgi:hypothetical protein